MITAYTLTENIPACTLESSTLPPHWINLVAPTEDEYAQISREHGIPLDYLHAALDINERPRIEHDKGTVLIIARAPIQETGRRIPSRTCPIAIIIAPAVVVTVCLKEGVVQELLCHKIRGAGQRPGVRLALSLLLRISTTFIESLRQMDERVEIIEKTLNQSMQNQELIKMLHIEKSLIYFLTALKGNHSVLEKVGANTALALTADEKDLLDDVLIENKQATDMAEIFSQIMGSLSDAFGAIVSNNLNKVMKFLTGMTIVFMIPSIVGALYGMNVPLPWQNSESAFVWLCVLCLALSAAVGYFLWKKKWM